MVQCPHCGAQVTGIKVDMLPITTFGSYQVQNVAGQRYYEPCGCPASQSVVLTGHPDAPLTEDEKERVERDVDAIRRRYLDQR